MIALSRSIILCTLYSCITQELVYGVESYELKYNVRLNGLSKSLAKHFSDEKLIKNSGNVISNSYALRDRVEKFIKNVKSKLTELGYYDTTIHYELVRNKDVIDVNISVSTGALFRVSEIKLNIADQHNLDGSDNLENSIYRKSFLQENINKPASGFYISNIAQWFIRALNKRGYPFAKIKSTNAIVDNSTNTVCVLVDAEVGQRIQFGPTAIQGLERINSQFVKNRICWHEGELFDIRNLEMTNQLLSYSQLFSSISSEIDVDHINDGVAPMLIKLQEDKMKALEVSLFYSTTKTYNFQQISHSQKKLRSFYGSIAWTHFSLFDGGEKLRIKATGAPFSVGGSGKSRDYEMLVELTKPDIFYARDSFVSSLNYDRQNKNAYYRLGKSISFTWSSPIAKNGIKTQIGFAVEDNAVTGPSDIFDKYKAFSVPIIVSYDTRDRILNPTAGYKISVKLAPQVLVNKRCVQLLNIYGTSVHKLFGSSDNIFAVWMNASRIFSGSIDITLDKKLYAGGVSSVRGYGSQMAGPMRTARSRDGTEYETSFPLGGTSCLEFGGELRKRIYKNISAVVFGESAAVGTLKKMYTGVGFGLRYDTVVGPVRMDFAFPLKRRRNVDSKMQFYLSFGQAF